MELFSSSLDFSILSNPAILRLASSRVVAEEEATSPILLPIYDTIPCLSSLSSGAFISSDFTFDSLAFPPLLNEIIQFIIFAFS